MTANVRSRVESVDLLRGVVMILMAVHLPVRAVVAFGLIMIASRRCFGDQRRAVTGPVAATPMYLSAAP